MSYDTLQNTSVTISITASPGAVSNYRIEYYGDINDTRHYYKTITDLGNLLFTLTNLVIYTPYTIIITANYTNGHSYPYTYSNFFTTLNQGPSSIFDITTYIDSIDIRFINMYNYPSAFIFNATHSTNQPISGSYTGIANTEYTYNLAGLSSNTTYTIDIITRYDTIENNIPVTRNYSTIYPIPITTLPPLENISA